MTVTLGKRKRRAELEDATPSQCADAPSPEHLQALFRRHFESQYQPLERLPAKDFTSATLETRRDLLEFSESEDSVWEGLDGAGVNADVEIVEHTSIPRSKRAEVPREELKAFMKPAPPRLSSSTIIATKMPARTKATTNSEDPAEKSLLANDLALQRLLSESHLLSSSPATTTTTSSTAPLTLHGSSRHRAQDMRLQSLGAKTSLLKQGNMPIAIRRGMEAKQTEREERRRREAKEAGVVLERVGKIGKKAKGEWVGTDRERGRRERGPGEPGVGRWKGGMLVLGKRDVEAIEGRKRGEGAGGGRGKGGRGRGRGRDR